MSLKKSDPDAEAVAEANAVTAPTPLPSGGGSYTVVDGKLVPDAPLPVPAQITEV